MALLKKHLTLSLRRTGKSYREVHEWMDGRQAPLRAILSRHNVLSLPRHLAAAEKKFGGDGAKEYLEHLKNDYRTHLVLIAWKLILRVRIRAGFVADPGLTAYQRELLYGKRSPGSGPFSSRVFAKYCIRKRKEGKV